MSSPDPVVIDSFRAESRSIHVLFCVVHHRKRPHSPFILIIGIFFPDPAIIASFV